MRNRALHKSRDAAAEEIFQGNFPMSAASKKAREHFDKMGELVAAYTGKHKMCQTDREVLRQILGYTKPTNSVLASDLTLRRRAGKEFGDMLVAMRKGDRSLQFYFWTIIHDNGNTSDRNPIIDIKGLQSIADRIFRRYEMDSLSVLEIQGLTNWPQGGEGRTLMAHIHGVSWTQKPLNCNAVRTFYKENQSWPKPFGADPINVKLIGFSDKDLRRVAYYLFKPPYDAKVWTEPDGRVCLMPTEKGYRPEFAMRILEGLSQLSLKSIVRATADGSRQRKDLFRRLSYRHKSRPDWQPGVTDASSIKAFWDKYRTKKRKKTYLPFEFKH
jgi:hypothetical protein